MDWRKNRIVQGAIFGALILAVATVLCSFFGVTHEIANHCPSHYQPECPRYNFVLFLLWKLIEIANAGSGLITAFATVVMAAFTAILVAVGRRADVHFRVSERAYVKLSHHPPGIYWENPRLHVPEKDREWWVRIDLRVKNFGKTPAQVTEICLAYKFIGNDEELPAVPDYSDGAINSAHAFLVTEDEFTHLTRTKIAIADKSAIWSGDRQLFVFGYVEYRDKFGTHHRGRYARHFEFGPQAPTPINIHTGERLVRDAVMHITNLTFVDQAGYNSDLTQRTDGSWPED